MLSWKGHNLSWKGTTPGPKNPTMCLKSTVQMLLQLPQAWCCDQFPRGICSSAQPLVEKLFPDIQPKPPPTQLQALTQVLSLVTGVRRLVPAAPLPLRRMLKTTVRPPLSLLSLLQAEQTK